MHHPISMNLIFCRLVVERKELLDSVAPFLAEEVNILFGT